MCERHVCRARTFCSFPRGPEGSSAWQSCRPARRGEDFRADFLAKGDDEGDISGVEDFGDVEGVYVFGLNVGDAERIGGGVDGRRANLEPAAGRTIGLADGGEHLVTIGEQRSQSGLTEITCAEEYNTHHTADYVRTPRLPRPNFL